MTQDQLMAAYGPAITQASTTYGVPPNVIMSVIQAESQGSATATSNKGAVGLMQLEPTTAGLSAAALRDPTTNIMAGTKYLSQQLTNTGNNLPQALANYNAGPGRAKTQPWPNETIAYVNKVVGLVGGNTTFSTTPDTVQYGANAVDAVAAQPVSGTALTSDQYASLYNVLNPPLVITTNLDQQPWYENDDIVQQNHPSWNPEEVWSEEQQRYVKLPPPANPFPVCFQVFFEPNYGSRLGATPSRPVTINLKASINSHEKAMQHIISKQKTRTGLLIDLWGMQPDSITGQGSTGIMQNQLGITDYISLMKPNDQALAAVRQGFSLLTQATSPLNPLTTIATAASQAEAASAAAAAMRQGFATTVSTITDSADTQVSVSADSFRVAARDAFAEFLWLFKNNGSVWFRSSGYTGITDAFAASQVDALAAANAAVRQGFTTNSQSQLGPDAWSSTTGQSTFQTVNSRNDVMTRGHVVMYFRNAAYAGYFKSLTWSLDATSPFRWNFTFVFAVESTTLNIGVP